MKKVYNAYCKAEEFLFSFLFAVMVALVFSSAIARGIGKPLAWSLDVAQLLLCWTSLVGADVAFRHDKFIGLDLFTRKMPVKVQKVLEIVVLVLMQVAFCIFIYYGVMLSIKSWKRSFQTLPISYSFITIALPVMSTLMTLTNILKITDKVKNFKKNVAIAMDKGKAYEGRKRRHGRIADYVCCFVGDRHAGGVCHRLGRRCFFRQRAGNSVFNRRAAHCGTDAVVHVSGGSVFYLCGQPDE